MSFKHKIPVICTWNATLLVSGLVKLPYNQVIGAFVVAAAAMLLVGVIGVFKRLMALIPTSLGLSLAVLCLTGQQVPGITVLRGANFEAPTSKLVSGMACGVFYIVIGSFASAMAEPSEREAALMTFVVTASNVSLLGLGSACWGIVVGLIAYMALRPRSSTKFS